MLTNKNVLSIDDSRAIRAFVSSLVSNAGARIAEAGTGIEAIDLVASEQAQGRHFDLILLDLVLPDIDGLEVLRRIRERDKDSAVVVLTGAGGVASATSAMQHGADGYVEKQYVTKVGGEPEFFYSLKQAMEHRAGYVARRQLDELRTDFYSMITHDLRNPAGTVLGLIKLLLAGKAGPLAPRQEEMLRLAQRSGEKFVSLITNYLDYSKIEAGYLKVVPAETDIASLLRSSAVQAELMAEAKNIALKLNVPPGPLRVCVDADKIEQVFDNLISNAIKYTPDHGSITVTLQQSERDVIVHVADTGAGIPKDQVGSLFTKYHRVPGSERQATGTGLGLLIVKEIVEAHRGTVSVISDGIPGHGSTFTVWLPAVVVAQSA